MSFAAFDLSKKSTGFAVWDGARAKPISGRWVLGSEFSTDGQVYATLHARMMELFRVVRFEFVAIEEQINPANLSGNTNIATLRVLAGLAAHAESFAYAVQCRSFQRINVSSWRRDFLSAAAVSAARAEAKRKRERTGKKASATARLKSLTVARCIQLGFDPRTDDEADALGLLDYFVTLRGIVPPWRRENALLAPLEVTG